MKEDYTSIIDYYGPCGKLLSLMESTDPWWRGFLCKCSIQYSNRVPTAGVTVRKGKIRIHINQKWWSEFDMKAQSVILKHEILHVLQGHCKCSYKRYMKSVCDCLGVSKEYQHKIINVAEAFKATP